MFSTKTSSLLLLTSKLVNLAYFLLVYLSLQISSTLKGHNFLILSPIFMIFHAKIPCKCGVVIKRPNRGHGTLLKNFPNSIRHNSFILCSFSTIYMSLESYRFLVSFGKKFYTKIIIIFKVMIKKKTTQRLGYYNEERMTL